MKTLEERKNKRWNKWKQKPSKTGLRTRADLHRLEVLQAGLYRFSPSKLKEYKLQETLAMKFKELKTQIKEHQKLLAARLKRVRSVRKPDAYYKASKELQEEYQKHGGWHMQFTQKEYRNTHIAYCIFFNKTPYEKIETPRENNKPDSRVIQQLQDDWKKQLDEEVVCSDS